MIETAIRNKLLDRSEIQSLVSRRIYYKDLPQNPTYPAITFFLVSGTRHHDIDVGYPRYQFDSWAETYAQAVELARQIRLALQREKGTWGSYEVIQGVFLNEADVEEPDDSSLYHRASDFKIIYREA